MLSSSTKPLMFVYEVVKFLTSLLFAKDLSSTSNVVQHSGDSAGFNQENVTIPLLILNGDVGSKGAENTEKEALTDKYSNNNNTKLVFQVMDVKCFYEYRTCSNLLDNKNFFLQNVWNN